jgi:hypothetical protein
MESYRRVVAGLALLALAGCGSTVQMTSQSAGGELGGASLGASNGLSGTVAGGKGAALGVPGSGPAVGAPSSVAPTLAPSAPGEATVGGPAGQVRGMTAKTIKIGVFTVAGFSSFGASLGVNVATGDQVAEAKAVINYLNAHGGIAGRRVIPVFHDESVAGAESNYEGEMQAACAAWTQDDHVYAVASPVGTVGDTLYQCLAKAGVVTSSAGESRDAGFFRQYANTFYMPVEMNLTRILRDNVEALYGAGYFTKGAKIGLVRLDAPEDVRAVSEGLQPALAAHGLKLTDQFATATGTQSVQQMSNAVLKFRAEGITHVLFTFVSPLFFMENAQSQKYFPRYGLHSRSSPAALLQGNAPKAQLHGSMGLGWQQYNDVDASRDPGPSSARAKLCLQLMKGAGQDTSARATALVGLWQCDALFFLHDALAAAPSYTLTGFRTGAESLGDYEAASTFRSAFGPHRLHDGASAYRLFSYDDACSCYRYVTPIRPAA